jgi:hypothetical protein
MKKKKFLLSSRGVAPVPDYNFGYHPVASAVRRATVLRASDFRRPTDPVPLPVWVDREYIPGSARAYTQVTSTQNGVEQRDVLLSLPLSFVLERTIKKVQDNQRRDCI